MSHNPSDSSHRREVIGLCRKIMSNEFFIDNDDIEVLRFLSKKGDYNDGSYAAVNKNIRMHLHKNRYSK